MKNKTQVKMASPCLLFDNKFINSLKVLVRTLFLSHSKLFNSKMSHLFLLICLSKIFPFPPIFPPISSYIPIVKWVLHLWVNYQSSGAILKAELKGLIRTFTSFDLLKAHLAQLLMLFTKFYLSMASLSFFRRWG